MKLVTLYRPVGPEELARIEASLWRRFPPRLEGQPIFYPVLQEAYALKIARWNVRESGAGLVTRFAVDAEYLQQLDVQHFDVQQGAAVSTRSTGSPERLDELNDHRAGVIEVIAALR